MDARQLRRFRLAAAVIAELSAGAAWAATDTTTFTVTARVNDACTISATDLAFGVYDPNAGTDTDATSTLTATCTVGTTYEIGLNTGGNSGLTSATTRAMGNGTDFLDYELYTDVGRTNIWGDVDPDRVSGTATFGGDNYTVFGRLPASQFVTTGNFNDTINVTIEF